MQNIFQFVLIAGITSIFLSVVAGMGSNKGSMTSQVLMFVGFVLLAAWFFQRLFLDLNRSDPEEELQERLQQREQERKTKQENQKD